MYRTATLPRTPADIKAALTKEGILPNLKDYASIFPEGTILPDLMVYHLDSQSHTLTYHDGLTHRFDLGIVSEGKKKQLRQPLPKDLLVTLRSIIDKQHDPIMSRNQAAFRAMDWPFNLRQSAEDNTPEERAEFEASNRNLRRWMVIDRVIKAELAY